MRFGTKTIHIGQEPDPSTGAAIPPVFQTSTFVQGVGDGEFEYTRHGNPNYQRLEKTLSAIEGAEFATVFSSGMGAISAVASILAKGDRVVALREVYGGTWRLFSELFKRYGVDFQIVDDREEAFLKALEPPTKMVVFETPTNPMMEVIDIAKVVKAAKKRNVLVVVDNTFASPFFQHPLELGADAVWHSTTKYIGGHSDLIGGVLITNNGELKERFDYSRMTLGLNPGPFDCWLASRGVKTLALRMVQHEKNALALAKFFQGHPKVLQVHHPGLESDPGHAIAKKQMSGFSGMFSVEFDLGIEETKKLISSFEYFALAISLGGVESLVNHSATMSHAPLPKAERARLGITDGLVRFSCGVEETEDLLEDVHRVFSC